jgi:uncharacterized surface protein with fasciclin (FAS1) repeats
MKISSKVSKVNVNAKRDYRGAKASNTPEPKMSQIVQGKGEKKSNGNGKTESEIIDEETMEAFARILQDFGSVTPAPTPPTTAPPTPAPPAPPTPAPPTPAPPTPAPTPALIGTNTPIAAPIAAPTPAPTPAPTTPRPTDAPSPAPTMQTIAGIIESEGTSGGNLSGILSILQRVSGRPVDFRLIGNDIFPFPFGRRELQFQKNNTFRTNDLFTLLDQPGAYTFFAPTNAAIGGLFARSLTFRGLLMQYDDFLPHLEDLLLYHGLNETRFISDFSKPGTATTLNLENVIFGTTSLGTVRINGRPIVDPDDCAGICSDIGASNGVVHFIDGVLLPDWTESSLLDLMNDRDNNLSILLDLLERSGLDSELMFVPLTREDLINDDGMLLGEMQGTTGLTLLAPTDEAFHALNGDVDLPFLLNLANGSDVQRDELKRILRYHIVDPGVFTSPRLDNGANLRTASGDVVVSVVDEIGMQDPIFMFNQATVTRDNILANNGVLYLINAVLNPNSTDGF